MKLTRDFYIPKGATKITAKDSSAVVYMTDPSSNRYIAMGFSGKRAKPTFHYCFKTSDRRWEYVKKFFENVASNEKSRKEAQVKRKSAPIGVVVGDILRASWGYGQTNVNYYQVTKIIGKRQVEMREIAADKTETAWMCGTCVPVPNQFISKPFRKAVTNGSAKISSCQYAFKVEKNTDGSYPSTQWSSYH